MGSSESSDRPPISKTFQFKAASAVDQHIAI